MKRSMHDSCFPVLARETTEEADVAVTNHPVLEVQSTGTPMLPESAVFVVDEAYELADRAMGQLAASTFRSDVSSFTRLFRRESILATELENAGDKVAGALDGLNESRLETLPLSLADGLSKAPGELQQAREDVNDLGDKDKAAAVAKTLTHGRIKALADVVEQLLSDGVGEGTLMLWVAHDDEGRSSSHVAPLDISSTLADVLFEGKTAILTSATPETGGSFRHIVGAIGFTCPSRGSQKGIDVGSPFDHSRQGILCATASLPPPGREGVGEAQFREIAGLVEVARGGALGLLTSRRAIETAVGYVRERLDVPVPCQGDDQFSTLVRCFVEDDATSLFGTLSLWQGVDVPGRTCRFVLISRIPFLRPNDSLTQVRTKAVVDTGGDGFMSVAVTHAALLLAQGVGRLPRRTDDRGVVTILDPRIIVAYYDSFLAASLSSIRRTKDPYVIRSVLRRSATAPDLTRDCAGDNDSTVQASAETWDTLAPAQAVPAVGFSLDGSEVVASKEET